MPTWGPSEQELAKARQAAIFASVASIDEVDQDDKVNDDDLDDDLGFVEEEDVGLVDALDAADLADHLRTDVDEIPSDDE